MCPQDDLPGQSVTSAGMAGAAAVIAVISVIACCLGTVAGFILALVTR